MMQLDRDGSIPLYLQVKAWLEEEIATGKLKPHRRVPSERLLSGRFGISRMTVRQALTEMVHDGRLYSRVGMGTFVAEPIMKQPLRSLTGFTEEIKARGSVPTSKVLRCELVTPSAGIARIFDRPYGTPVVALDRLRLSDGEPLMLETNLLSFSGVERLLGVDLSGSLYELLGREYGLVPSFADQEVIARRSRPREVGLLGMDEETAVLEFTRTTSGSSGQVFEHVVSVYRGDRYRFVFHLEHEGSG
jgi:GntR family transcriptional regulator